MPAQTVIQIRRDTAANWESTDPTLASGEIGFDTTNNQIKIGNGSDEWTVLDYASGGASVQISETAPVDPDEGNVWFNSTDGRAYIYYDSTWVDLNPGIAGPAGKFTVSETEPADPAVGDGWFNSGTARLFIYYDNFWVEATSNYIGPTGEPGIVVQTSAPTDTDVLWLDSDDPADAVAVPAGGSTGQVLAKATGDDYDTEWTSLREPPSGNAIINGAFDIWQRGTSVSFAANDTKYSADRWYVTAPNATFTVSRQNSTNTGFQYALRLQRTSGQTGVGTPSVSQSFESVNSIPLAGQTVVMSFYARKGANYSATSDLLTAQIRSGTGTDQNIGAVAITGNKTVVESIVTLTSSWQRFTLSGTTDADVTQLFSRFSHTTVGTAGADDWYEITGVQLEAGSTATAFRRNANSLQGELAACQRYYWRNTPGTAYGTYGQGSTFNTTVANIRVVHPVQMRANPTSVDFSNIQAVDSSFSGTFSSISISGAETSQLVSSFDVGGTGYTANRPASLRNANNAAGFIGLSAEL
jgi:hypothetical protein